jgi:hypothetical protein
LNISTECVSDVQALETEADDLLGLLPFYTALQKGSYPPQMQNVEIVDGGNLPLFLNTDLQNSKSLSETTMH